MGTEIMLFLGMDNALFFIVKLNNPQMGTEIYLPMYNNHERVTYNHVKLNNPQMGTEITSVCIFVMTKASTR